MIQSKIKYDMHFMVPTMCINLNDLLRGNLSCLMKPGKMVFLANQGKLSHIRKVLKNLKMYKFQVNATSIIELNPLLPFLDCMSGGHSPSIFIGGLVTILVLYDIPVASMLDHADQSLTRHGSGTEKIIPYKMHYQINVKLFILQRGSTLI